MREVLFPSRFQTSAIALGSVGFSPRRGILIDCRPVFLSHPASALGSLIVRGFSGLPIVPASKCP